MAKYQYTTASEVPVRVQLTVYEMRTLCNILRREIARKDEDRWYAEALYKELVEAISNAGDAMRLEGDWITKHTIQHLKEDLQDAHDEANKVEA